MVLSLMPTTVFAQTENSTAVTKEYLQNNSWVLTGGETADEMAYFYLDENIDVDSAITVKGYVTLDINGHVLNNPNDIQVIKVGNYSDKGYLTIQDSGSGLITAIWDSVYNIIDVNSGSEFILKSGTICSVDSSTAVGVSSGAKAILEGGKVDGGFYIYKGTVYAHGGNVSGEVVNINGKITRNNDEITTATSFEGHVYNGGEIEWGNFVNSVSNSFFKEGFVDGSYVGTISGGRFEGTVTNGYKRPSATSAVESKTGTITGGTFLNGITENEGLSVITNTNNIIVGVKTESEIKNAFNNGYSGVILTSNIDVTTFLYFIYNGTLSFSVDLNGYVLEYTGSIFESMFYISEINEDEATFSLLDSNPNAVHKFTPNEDGLWILDEENGTKTVYGGVITKSVDSILNAESCFGVAIYLDGGVTFIMNGGNIVGCEGGTAGAVFANNHSEFYFNKGSIVGCKSSRMAGAFYIENNVSLYMNGGVISDCEAPDGNIINFNGTIYANGGEINGKITNRGTITRSDDATDYTTFYGDIILEYLRKTGTVEDKAKLTVTFDSNGGSVVSEQKVLKGQKLTNTTASTKDNFAFDGWYNGDEKWDFDDSVMENMTLTAKWSCAGHNDEVEPFHECDYCGETFSQCSGGTATCKNKAVCTTCGEEYGDLDPDNHEGVKEWSTKNATQHEQTWNCCGVVVVSLENHEWENGVCTECEYPCQHTGGTATCVNKAVCEICGEEYGDLDPENHEGEEGWSITPNKHEQIWDCCGEIIVALENHEWENGICTECEIPCLHDYQWQNENGQYWQKCQICGLETSKSDVPNPEISGNDTICQGHDWTFTFTLPEGSTDVTYGYNFEYKGTGDLIPTCENGVYTITIPADLIDGEISFKLNIYATTADGFAFSSTKEVAIISDHEGGTATCVNKAVCEICGDEYGEFDATNHVGEKEWSTKNETQHEEKFNCCDEITVALENHEWENGTCTECGYACQHVGGEASCKSKALCENCGEEYGEINPLKHAMLKHIEGVDATYEKDGNSEYWYCEDCDKYFSDENGEFEISLADTVITKLEKPADKDDVPNTGDNHTLLWIALFIATGGFTKLIINDKKKSK